MEKFKRSCPHFSSQTSSQHLLTNNCFPIRPLWMQFSYVFHKSNIPMTHLNHNMNGITVMHSWCRKYFKVFCTGQKLFSILCFKLATYDQMDLRFGFSSRSRYEKTLDFVQISSHWADIWWYRTYCWEVPKWGSWLFFFFSNSKWPSSIFITVWTLPWNNSLRIASISTLQHSTTIYSFRRRCFVG